jgi:hypothetical protein
MPIASHQNPYPGVDAHLNSFLQQDGGGWESFHSVHIAHLYEMLDSTLPPNYYVAAEKSLQIGALGFDRETSRRYRPDLAIYQHAPTETSSRFSATTPTATLPLVEVQDDDENTFTSIVIYETQEGKYPGKPVTWIEILSPANKPPGSSAVQYSLKRRQTLRSGLSLVEIDYLHQSRPINPLLPSYPDGDDGAYPYMVLISTPADEQVEFYGFHVDSPLPIISIPLAGKERTEIDFGKLYRQTAEHRIFRIVVNYEDDPVNFTGYKHEDRAKIRAIIEEARRKNASEGKEDA